MVEQCSRGGAPVWTCREEALVGPRAVIGVHGAGPPRQASVDSTLPVSHSQAYGALIISCDSALSMLHRGVKPLVRISEPV
jgi:hypothetical protein